MSLRIIQQGDLGTTGGNIPAVVLPSPQNIYHNRAARARSRMYDHPLADYLSFIADISDIQAALCKTLPVMLPEHATYWQQCALRQTPPLDFTTWPRDPVWQEVLRQLISRLRHAENKNRTLEPVYHAILALDADSLEAQAQAILQADSTHIDMTFAPFIGAALSYYWTWLASQLPTQSLMLFDDEYSLCPVCHSPPSTSLIRPAPVQGLRYLHCSLCESEWHMVRVKCTSCFSTKGIQYYHLEQNAVVGAESCDSCHGYLKIINRDKDRHADPLVEDLASLALDLKLEEAGYLRSGRNLLLCLR